MNKLEKEFIPYGQALALKELEFDEPCLGWYVSESYGLEYGKVVQSDLLGDAVIAPTFSQCFRWFIEKYNLHISICHSVNGKFDCWTNDGNLLENGKYCDFNTYEEAELACLQKLIEIVKGGEQ